MFGPMVLELGGRHPHLEDHSRNIFVADLVLAALLTWIVRPSSSISPRVLPVPILGVVMRLLIPSIGFGLLVWFCSYYGMMEYLKLREEAHAAEEHAKRYPT